jgi:hypothetical protein
MSKKKELTFDQKMIVRLRDTIEHLDPYWTEDVPEEEGYYWVYGYPFKEEMMRDGKYYQPETFVVQAMKIGDGSITMVRNGHFWGDVSERGHCVFKRIQTPLGPKFFDHDKAIKMDKDPRLGKYMSEQRDEDR